MGMFSGVTKTVKDLILGRDGPSNPYAPVDWGQNLEAPGNAYDYTGAYKKLMDMINAPSSVEAVQQDVEGQQMRDLMGQVDVNTRGAYGSTMMDMADRGLVGPGQSSDIAANALGQVQAQGALTKSGINQNYALARLQRLFGKEQAAQGAQGTWANTLASMAEGARGRNIQRMLGQSSAYNEASKIANQHTPGMLETFGNEFASSYGKELGKNTAGPSIEELTKMFSMGA